MPTEAAVYPGARLIKSHYDADYDSKAARMNEIAALLHSQTMKRVLLSMRSYCRNGQHLPGIAQTIWNVKFYSNLNVGPIVPLVPLVYFFKIATGTVQICFLREPLERKILIRRWRCLPKRHHQISHFCLAAVRRIM